MEQAQAVLRDGVFEILYFEEDRPGSVQNRLNLIIRGSEVFGSDDGGGVYSGEISWRHVSESQTAFALNVSCQMPPHAGEFMIGQDVVIDGAPISITGELNLASPRQLVPVIVNGWPAEIEIGYFGPLSSFYQAPASAP